MVWWLMYETVAISVTKNLVSACLFQLSQPKKPILKLQIQKAHLVRYKKQLFGKKVAFWVCEENAHLQYGALRSILQKLLRVTFT